MKYKLIISDYDGTLGCAPSNDIPKQTLDAINKYTEKGGIFVVCSGREYSSIRTICIEQGLKGLLACFQGAMITNLETEEVLFSGGMSEEDAMTALSAAEESGLQPIVYTPNGFYIEKDTEYTAKYEKAVRVKGLIANAKDTVRKFHKVCKLGWLGDPKVVSEFAKKLNQEYLEKGIQFNIGVPFLMEAINPKHSKGNAVRFLAEYYNIPLSSVMAVGDSTNDIDLISGEWHGVAVGDGREELKAVAKEITVPFKDMPIKHLIEKYCL